MIFFVGSVFSPYYAWDRRAGRPQPERHVAANIALYGEGGYRWAMTERGEAQLSRSASHLAVRNSAISRHTDGTLTIDIDERCAPLPRKLSGRLHISPILTGPTAFTLDPAGRHRWHPFVPMARIRVEMDHLGRSWSGNAYLDHNIGDEPVETRFVKWSWTRTIESKRTRIFYDTQLRDGTASHLHVAYDRSGQIETGPAPPVRRICRTRWGLPIEARSDPGGPLRLAMRWEDGPFYARSLLACTLEGQAVEAVHEAVSLDRFRHPVVQCMLPFRMPRRAPRHRGAG